MSLLGQKLETRRELYLHDLGAALTMEKTILDMLPKLIEEGQHEELVMALRQHREQTETHVLNLERAFEALGEEPDDSPCPAIEGLEKEGEANLKMVDESLNDTVILAGVSETEHHEIAVYEGLITKARAMGEDGVATLLEANLHDEEATLHRAKLMTEQLAKGMPHQ